MGIHNLWKILLPARQTRTFTQISVTEGFESNRKDGCIKIGIDTSIWMNEAQTAINCANGPGTQAGENPVLRVLFFRLCRLLALPVIPIFVFDGNDRPLIKRGVQVKGKAHWLTERFQCFIEAFGFYWYMAPGEAEADLAELNSRNMIDAIISSDSDTLVFGGRCVIRIPNAKDAGDNIFIYTSEVIQSHPRVLLTREGLFLWAILNGGDYDTVGLAGCGPTITYKLAQSDLAHTLYCAASTLPRGALSEFLVDWREKLKIQLMFDPNGLLGRKYPAVARNISNKFPSVDVLLLYAHPVTSWTADTIPDSSQWNLHQPNLTALSLLCEKSFSWGTTGQIITRFQQNLWRGIIVRYLIQAPDSSIEIRQYLDGSLSEGSFSRSDVLQIHQAKLGPGGPSTHANVNGYVVKVATYGLIRDTVAYLDGASRELALKAQQHHFFAIWIPAVVLISALPQLVQRFHDQGKKTATVSSQTYPPVLAPIMPSNVDIGENNDRVFLGYIDLCTPPPE